MQEQRYTTRQAAEICQVNIATVINWIDQGGLKAFKTYGGHRRVLQTDLIAFMKKLDFPIPKELLPEIHRKILIVDDDKGILKSVSTLMKKKYKDCQVYTANSGFVAGYLVKKLKPECVILDIKMPGIDGFQICEFIRKKNKEIKIIAMTGYPSEAARKKILSKGANAYLEKPLNIDELIEIMEDLCKECKVNDYALANNG